MLMMQHKNIVMIVNNIMAKKYLYLLVIALIFYKLNYTFCYATDNKTQIIKDNISIKKTLFYSGNFKSSIRTIQSGYFTSTLKNKNLAILSQFDGIIIDLKTKLVKKRLSFSRGKGILHPEIIDKDNDGNIEILNQGGGYSEIGILNIEGESIIKYPYRNGVNYYHKMAGSDIDNDGKMEFFIASSKGIICIDYLGQQKWKTLQPKFPITKASRNIFIVRQNEHESGKIYAVVKNNYLTYDTIVVIDKDGNVEKKIKIPMSISKFEIINLNNENYILTSNGNNIYLINLKGHIIIEHPVEFYIKNIKGITIKSNNQNYSYIVILSISKSSISKSDISIFNFSNKKLIYKEIINMSNDICKINSNKFLIGDGKTNIWEYKFAK